MIPLEITFLLNKVYCLPFFSLLFFNPTYTTYVRNLETGEENTIEINDGKSIGEFVGLKDNELYYVTTDYVGEDSSSNLCKINLHNGKTSIIYQTELKHCINNAQFITW